MKLCMEGVNVTHFGFPRPQSRGRIETAKAIRSVRPGFVSPGPKAGGGLKLCQGCRHIANIEFPPAPKPGAD